RPFAKQQRAFFIPFFNCTSPLLKPEKNAPLKLVCVEMDVFGIELNEFTCSSYSRGVSDISKKTQK
ncbi:hypothetical protein, partial [Winogradskyella sp. KYW1333]|uniref:hypothetical protein n=1 Tax=Winogradskyella sp. KYW1333 TaxID=2282123 RepID=UPI000E0730C1